MPAGYAATTGVESTYGDAFTYEISNLRVAERLPWVIGAGGAIAGGPIGWPTPASPGRFHLEPAGAIVAPLAANTRRPSNIVPIRTGAGDPNSDLFYLGLDIEFVGTHLGLPGYPNTVSVEVKFFLEAYGAGNGGGRHEINIASQIFADLNANPIVAVNNPDTELRHQLWVQVAEANYPAIVQSPAGLLWDDLFNPDTIYRVAASVKIVAANLIPLDIPAATGFIEGAVFQTEEWSPHTV